MNTKMTMTELQRQLNLPPGHRLVAMRQDIVEAVANGSTLALAKALTKKSRVISFDNEELVIEAKNELIFPAARMPGGMDEYRGETKAWCSWTFVSADGGPGAAADVVPGSSDTYEQVDVPLEEIRPWLAYDPVRPWTPEALATVPGTGTLTQSPNNALGSPPIRSPYTVVDVLYPTSLTDNGQYSVTIRVMGSAFAPGADSTAAISYDSGVVPFIIRRGTQYRFIHTAMARNPSTGRLSPLHMSSGAAAPVAITLTAPAGTQMATRGSSRGDKMRETDAISDPSAG
jgi:hypothetical protein